MENKIYFLEEKQDIKLAEKLCALCVEGIELPKNAFVLSQGDKAYSDGKFDAVAVELGLEDKVQAGNEIYTYSVGQSNADICAHNFQKREHSRSLELLCGSFMGRVNIPVNSKYTELSVLYCAAGLFAAGIPIKDVLKIINSKIS